MKVAWFTPLWKTSAIAAFSVHVAEALSDTCSIELWVPDTLDAIKTDLPVVRFTSDSPQTIRRLAARDIAFYNLGNNYPFHAAIFEVARRWPGVVVLHDRVLHHYYLDEARFGFDRLEKYSAALERWYGPGVALEGQAHLGTNRYSGYPPDDFAARHPLVEEALLGARGVVVHSRTQLEGVRKWWVGPVAHLHLPARGAEYALAPPRPSRTDGPVHLVSFGVVGPTKQVHLTIEALARRPDLQDHVRYTVAGPFDPESAYGAVLTALVQQHRLEQVVHFTGRLSESELSELKDTADAFLNLRWPSTEGGSASLTEQLLTGRPVVVSRSGVFDEIPDDAVIKLAAQDADSVARTIDLLVNDAQCRAQVGAAGRTYARRHTGEAYARGILRLCNEARRWSVPGAMLDRIGDVLRRLGASDDLPVLDTVAAELSQLFGPSFTDGRDPRARHRSPST